MTLPNYTWILPEDAPSTSTEAPAPAIAPGLVPQSQGKDFLGAGPLHPLHRGASDFEMGTAEALVQSCVEQVLGVEAASDHTRGELPWRDDFGSLLHLLRHQRNDDVLADLARVYVAGALQRWEPRITLKEVQTSRQRTPEGDETVFVLRLRYNLIADQVTGNEVFLSDIKQTVTVSA